MAIHFSCADCDLSMLGTFLIFSYQIINLWVCEAVPDVYYFGISPVTRGREGGKVEHFLLDLISCSKAFLQAKGLFSVEHTRITFQERGNDSTVKKKLPVRGKENVTKVQYLSIHCKPKLTGWHYHGHHGYLLCQNRGMSWFYCHGFGWSFTSINIITFHCQSVPPSLGVLVSNENLKNKDSCQKFFKAEWSIVTAEMYPQTPKI